MDIIELLNELAEQQESDLKARKRDELRATLNRLKSKDSARINKLRKNDLIAEILEAVAEYKETLSKAEAFDRVVPDLTDEELANLDEFVTKVDIEDSNDLGQIAKETYEQFRAICQTRYVDGVWLEYPAQLADLGNQLAARLEAKGNASTTLLNYRNEVLNIMQRLLELEREQHYFGQMWVYLTGHSYADRFRKSRGKGSDCLPCFAKSLYTIWQFTHSVTKKETEKAGRDLKEGTYKGLDITELLSWANDVLTKLDPTDQDSKRLWKPVSVALALATGRRQVEIHCTGTFELVDEYHVSFTGQAKARNAAYQAYLENPSYVIPTLLKAELVVKAHTWMKEHCHKFYPTEKQVNDNVNRDVNQFLKTTLGKTVKTYDEVGNEVPTVGADFTYHDLREIYALASYNAEGCKKFKRSMAHKWVNEVLGEDRGGKGIVSTAMRYLDEYDLVEASASRV